MKIKISSLFHFLSFAFIPILLVFIFSYGFSLWSFYISLHEWKGLGGILVFTGLKNYIEFFSNSIAIKTLTNTFILAVSFILSTTLLGLVLAIFLDVGLKGTSVFKTVFLLPLSFSFVISATMWTWMFSPFQGTINSILRILGLESLTQPWITSTEQALLCVLIVYIWQFSGFVTLIYYAGISNIPKEQIDAATVDGATLSQKYLYIIIPQLKGETIGVMVILLFYALRVFDLVYLLTGGGPALSSEVLATYMYRVTFNQNLFGYGATVGFITFLIAIIIIIPFQIFFRKR